MRVLQGQVLLNYFEQERRAHEDHRAALQAAIDAGFEVIGDEIITVEVAPGENLEEVISRLPFWSTHADAPGTA